MRVPVQVVPQAGVLIGTNYYCKTREGLRTVLTGLREFGYAVKGKRFQPRDPMPPADIERRCTPLWFASLPASELAQCLSCKGVIDPYGTRGEGRPCEFCDAQTMREPANHVGGMKVPNTRDIIFWKGKVYPATPGVPGAFNFPTSIGVYEAWHWAPMRPGPDLMYHLVTVVGGINLDANWYEPDERIQDMGDRLKRMTQFVQNFTTVNRDMWSVVMTELKREKRVFIVREQVVRLISA